MAYRGAWLTQSQDYIPVPIQAPIDPQHLNPDPNPQFQGQPPDWIATAPAPDLPYGLMPPPVAAIPTGVGPVSHDPLNPMVGPGFAPGLTEPQSMDDTRSWHADDDGSYGAAHWHHMTDRDGQPHADILADVPMIGDSPQTLQLQRTGVGQPNDPNARVGQRLWRWVDRKIDWHRWDVSFRPVRPRYARPQAATQVMSPTQTTPHTPSIVGWDPSSPDRFVAGIVRRSPGNWDEPLTTDGTIRTITGAASAYGLTTYGL